MNTAKKSGPAPVLANGVINEIKKAGKAGIDSSEIFRILKRGVNISTVRSTISRLEKRGIIFSGGKIPRLYFLNMEWADCYSRSQSEKKQKPVEPPIPKRLGTTSVAIGRKANWGSQEAIKPDGVKHIIVEAPRGRFEPTGEESYFSSLQIGNYKPSESAIARAYGA